jgi:hypothetical protein
LPDFLSAPPEAGLDHQGDFLLILMEPIRIGLIPLDKRLINA